MYEGYVSGNIGPQRGEPRCDGREEVTHWFCPCDRVNPIGFISCVCGKGVGDNIGVVLEDPPE